jgi:16S rRNA (guanine527-N7)-methyltransferase
VADLAILAEYCLPFCRVGGLFVAQKKIGIDDEIRRAAAAFDLLGGRLAGLIPVALPGVDERQLVVVEKFAPTSDRYPRRTGVPAKRPLA